MVSDPGVVPLSEVEVDLFGDVGGHRFVDVGEEDLGEREV
jgi:hypothetical protein